MNTCEFKYDNNVIVNYDKYKIVYYTDNKLFSDCFLESRVSSEKTFRSIITYFINNNIINKKNNIIDSGAWIGDNSIPWAMNIDGIVYAIDPSQENCDFIDETANYNSIDNLKTLCNAIGDIEKVLSTNDSLNHCSFVYNSNCTEMISNNSGINTIKSTTLDILYNLGKIDNIGFIHLDVEGMEYDALKGSIKIIDLYRPIVAYENHLELDKNIEKIKNFFKERKYIVRMINEVLEGCRPDCRNFLAIPEEIDNNINYNELHISLNAEHLFTP